MEETRLRVELEDYVGEVGEVFGVVGRVDEAVFFLEEDAIGRENGEEEGNILFVGGLEGHGCKLGR